MASFSSRIAIYQTIGCVLLDHAMPLKDIVVYHASWRTIPLYIIPVRVAFGIVLAVVAARLQQSTQRALASAGVSVASSLAIILPGHNISAVWIVWSLVLMFTVAYLYYLDDFGAMKKDLEAVLDGDEDEYLRFAREEILLVMNLSTKVLVTIFSIGVGFVVSALWRGWAPNPQGSLAGPDYREVVVAFAALFFFVYVLLGFALWAYLPAFRLLRKSRLRLAKETGPSV